VQKAGGRGRETDAGSVAGRGSGISHGLRVFSSLMLTFWAVK
jgi:hypothetical protein